LRDRQNSFGKVDHFTQQVKLSGNSIDHVIESIVLQQVELSIV
jgi:hypothetical protein